MAAAHLYEQISKNKRDSVLLILSVLFLFALLGLAFGKIYDSPTMGLVLALSVASLYALISYWAGDSIILFSLGAKPIPKEENPMLYNVVEEMSIAAGLPIPKIYVIPSHASNAFAAGISPEKASIAVTTGLLEILNREELQGVLGHEMAHIKNFDSRFSLLMAVMVGAIALLCDFFWRSRLGKSSSREDAGRAQALFLIIALVLAILAPLVAKIIQLSVSRRRELLADGTSAELTRNPGALARALEKIATDPDPLDVANRATQHLFIINPLNTLKANKQEQDILTHEKSGWFDTHPPVGLRIRLLREMAHTAL